MTVKEVLEAVNQKIEKAKNEHKKKQKSLVLKMIKDRA